MFSQSISLQYTSNNYSRCCCLLQYDSELRICFQLLIQDTSGSIWSLCQEELVHELPPINEVTSNNRILWYLIKSFRTLVLSHRVLRLRCEWAAHVLKLVSFRCHFEFRNVTWLSSTNPLDVSAQTSNHSVDKTFSFHRSAGARFHDGCEKGCFWQRSGKNECEFLN